jgi:hypothetical protein
MKPDIISSVKRIQVWGPSKKGWVQLTSPSLTCSRYKTILLWFLTQNQQKYREYNIQSILKPADAIRIPPGTKFFQIGVTNNQNYNKSMILGIAKVKVLARQILKYQY